MDDDDNNMVSILPVCSVLDRASSSRLLAKDKNE